jgi:hypothetical protein
MSDVGQLVGAGGGSPLRPRGSQDSRFGGVDGALRIALETAPPPCSILVGVVAAVVVVVSGRRSTTAAASACPWYREIGSRDWGWGWGTTRRFPAGLAHLSAHA